MSPDRISVVTNGVEMSAFPIGAPPQADGVTRLIYTGTLAPYQDVDLLLEAFAKARRVRPDLRLSMAVSNPFDPYEAQVSRLGIREAIDLLLLNHQSLGRGFFWPLFSGTLATAALAVRIKRIRLLPVLLLIIVAGIWLGVRVSYDSPALPDACSAPWRRTASASC